jgi:hypothetical protein
MSALPGPVPSAIMLIAAAKLYTPKIEFNLIYRFRHCPGMGILHAVLAKNRRNGWLFHPSGALCQTLST